jgi:hypothetical protein
VVSGEYTGRFKSYPLDSNGIIRIVFGDRVTGRMASFFYRVVAILNEIESVTFISIGDTDAS